MYANKRQIALNTPEQPGGISPPLTPLEALNKLDADSSLWIYTIVWQQVSDTRPTSHCVVYQLITAAVVKAHHIGAHADTHTHAHLCLSARPLCLPL